MISLGSVIWGSRPEIPISFEYEKQRSGADMQYRLKVTVSSLTGGSYFGYPIYFSWAFDGVYVTYVTLKEASPSQWSNSITYTTPWYTVANKTTGTTGVGINVYSGSGSNRSTHYAYQMEVDPAASKISVPNGTLGTPLKISLTRYNSAFTDHITYACGTASGDVAKESNTTSVTWGTSNGNTLALAKQNTAGQSVVVTFTVTTYSGTKVVGTDSTSATLTIPDSVKPSVALGIIDVAGYYDIYGAYVQGYSKLKITATPTKAYDSPIKSYEITADGATYNTSPVTTNALRGKGDLAVTAKVTDARTRSSDPVSVPITVLEYAKPDVRLAAYRCDQAGTKSEEGAYIKISTSHTISSLNGENSSSYEISYTDDSGAKKTITGTDRSSESGPIPCSIARTNKVSITVTDKVSSYSMAVTVPIAYTLMDFYNTGKGVALGKVATRDGLDCAMQNVYFNNRRLQEVGSPQASGDAVPLGFLQDYIVNQGTSGVWTYRKWSSGLAELWGHGTATHENGSVLASEEMTYPFALVSASCGIGTLNSAGGNAGSALPWNLKLVYGLAMCQVWIHNTGGNFTLDTALDASVYITGRWK